MWLFRVTEEHAPTFPRDPYIWRQPPGFQFPSYTSLPATTGSQFSPPKCLSPMWTLILRAIPLSSYPMIRMTKILRTKG
ncbi:hypothetical protein NCS52_00804200 [Fusarium sp. LHS14.1]|nr:hypothetical protein NCS52_00804200 [Fusarium sp. LHS14.1]